MESGLLLSDISISYDHGNPSRRDMSSWCCPILIATNAVTQWLRLKRGLVLDGNGGECLCSIATRSYQSRSTDIVAPVCHTSPLNLATREIEYGGWHKPSPPSQITRGSIQWSTKQWVAVRGSLLCHRWSAVPRGIGSCHSIVESLGVIKITQRSLSISSNRHVCYGEHCRCQSLWLSFKVTCTGIVVRSQNSK